MLVRIQVSYTLTSDTCTYLRLLDNGLDRPKHVRYIIYIQGIHKIMVHFQKLTRKKRRTTMVRLFQTVHETHAALNHRSGHLKTEHTESLFLLRRHLGNWPRGPAVSMRNELLVAHEKLGQLPLLTVYVVTV